MKKIMIIIYIVMMTKVFSQTNNCPDSLQSGNEKVQIKILPFAFYDNSIGLVFGGLTGIKGFAQNETLQRLVE